MKEIVVPDMGTGSHSSHAIIKFSNGYTPLRFGFVFSL